MDWVLLLAATAAVVLVIAVVIERRWLTMANRTPRPPKSVDALLGVSQTLAFIGLGGHAWESGHPLVGMFVGAAGVLSVYLGILGVPPPRENR